MGINKYYPNENKQRLFGACCSKGVSQHHLCLAETQRQAEEWESFNLIFIYLFMAVLGLSFCARAFSTCGERGPLFIAVRGPLIVAASLCCGAQAPDAQAQ